jgi:hypothetical protein
MASTMTLAEIKEFDKELYAYDVAQGGWQHGLSGAHHILTHLVKDSFNKSFIDQEVVQREIAPDSVMYGLRLARWGSVSMEGLIEAQEKAMRMLGSLSVQNAMLPKSRLAHQAAIHALAELLHDNDHQNDSSHTPEVTKITGVSGLLFHSAFLQAENSSFDLGEAFRERLVSLKERCGIPQLASNESV